MLYFHPRCNSGGASTGNAIHRLTETTPEAPARRVSHCRRHAGGGTQQRKGGKPKSRERHYVTDREWYRITRN